MMRLLHKVRHRSLKKGGHALRVGTVANDIVFVDSGFLRDAFDDPLVGGANGPMSYDEGFVVTDAEIVLTKTPGEQSIRALEPRAIGIIPWAAQYEGRNDDHEIERFGRLMLEQGLTGSQRRASRRLTLQPEERYRALVQIRPGVARPVPQCLIASYLGLALESLSRIRRRSAPGRDFLCMRADFLAEHQTKSNGSRHT